MKRLSLQIIGFLACFLWMVGLVQSAEPVNAAQEQVVQQQNQPLNNAPVWREVRSEKEHFTTSRAPEAGVLIQTGGNIWRHLRNGPITQYGGWLLLLVPLAILGFWRIRGTIRLHGKPTGHLMQRFSSFERLVHWGTAITFMILAVTGLLVLFGKHVIAPVFGPHFLGMLLNLSKPVHNYVGPVFGIFLIIMIFMFLRDNVWERCDALWIRKAGGVVSGEHVPSGRFNFGEKTWFWIGVAFLGGIVAISGLALNFPNFGQIRTDMQIANLVHAIGAILLLVLSFGHIYMGTLGVEGAYQSMKTGYVDETWAREHHLFWHDDIKTGKSGHP